MTVEPQWSQSSGSNVIPRRARPGLAGLRPHNPRFRAKKEQPKRFEGLSPDSHGHNLALTVLYVPCSLDSGSSLPKAARPGCEPPTIPNLSFEFDQIPPGYWSRFCKVSTPGRKRALFRLVVHTDSWRAEPRSTDSSPSAH